MLLYLCVKTCQEGNRRILIDNLVKMGMFITNIPWEADIIVYGKCANRKDGIVYGLSSLKTLCLQKKAGAKLILWGCLGRRISKEAMSKSFPEVDFCFTKVEDVINTIASIASIDVSWDVLQCKSHLKGVYKRIQICDGCNNNCTFCKVTGGNYPLVSMPYERIIQMANFYRSNGIEVINLDGLNCSQYGMDFPEGKPLLHKLIKDLVSLGFTWIMLSSIMPKDSYPELVEVMATTKEIVWIDFEMQTTSDRVLNDMKRGYTHKEFDSIVKKIQEGNPSAIIHTNVLGCYPTESGDDVLENVLYIVNRDNFIWTLSTYFDAISDASGLEKLPDRKYNLYERFYSSYIHSANHCFVESKIGAIIPAICSEVLENGYECIHPFDVDGTVFVPFADGEEHFKIGRKVRILVTSGTMKDGNFLYGRLIKFEGKIIGDE